MMERKAKNSTGYTLVEFMVSMALLTIIMLGAYGVLVTGDTIYVKDNNLMNMQGQTRNAVDRMVRESRPATSQTIVTNFNVSTCRIPHIIFDFKVASFHFLGSIRGLRYSFVSISTSCSS